MKKFQRVYAESTISRMYRKLGLPDEIKIQMISEVARTTANTPKVGRNEPCPCGSDKKYKRCCGR